MKIEHVTFKHEITLYGSYLLPRSVSMKVPEHTTKWVLSYDAEFQVIECLIIDPRSEQTGRTFVIPKECAQSWLPAMAVPAEVPEPVSEAVEATKPINAGKKPRTK